MATDAEREATLLEVEELWNSPRERRRRRDRGYRQAIRDNETDEQREVRLEREHWYRSQPKAREWRREYYEENRSYLLEQAAAHRRADQELTKSRATVSGKWMPAEDEAMRRLLREGNDQLSVALLLGRTLSSVHGRLKRLRRNGVHI